MATAEQCEAALHTLGQQMAANESAGRRASFDRRLSCTIRDLGVVFTGHLTGGRLLDIGQAEHADGQVRLDLSSDDLLGLVEGRLTVPAAWASGRLKIDASIMDLVRLKSIF